MVASNEGGGGLPMMIDVRLSAEQFDAAVHGKDTLPECGDLAMIIKPAGSVEGNAICVFTFKVQLPDGRLARAQAVTSARCVDAAAAALRGYRDGGHIKF